jgi:hypothetical protein
MLPHSDPGSMATTYISTLGEPVETINEAIEALETAIVKWIRFDRPSTVSEVIWNFDFKTECEPCARVSPGLTCDFENYTRFELIHTMDLDLLNNSEGAAQLPLREQLLEDREVAAIDSNEVEVAMTNSIAAADEENGMLQICAGAVDMDPRETGYPLHADGYVTPTCEGQRSPIQGSGQPMLG